MTRETMVRYLEELPGQPQTWKGVQVLSQDGHTECQSRTSPFPAARERRQWLWDSSVLGDGNGSAAGVLGSVLRKASHEGDTIAVCSSPLLPLLSVPRLPLTALESDLRAADPFS